ncbi:MAG: DivIVA domain-containing protein [Gemmatimonadota bacterium]
MDLTPLDVRKKKDDFKRSLRGYDTGQVDTFLDMCAERLEQLVQRDNRQQGELAALRERLGAFEERERALNEALVTAQELREEARTQAERSAELKLREADQEAEGILKRAEAQTESSRRALEDLKVRRTGFLRSLRWSLERFLGELEEEERRIAEGRWGPEDGESEAESSAEANAVERASGADAPDAGTESVAAGSPETGEGAGAEASGPNREVGPSEASAATQPAEHGSAGA